MGSDIEALCKCKGIAMLVFGVLLVANEYLLQMNPWLVIGIAMIVGGAVLLMKPSCCGACRLSSPKVAQQKQAVKSGRRK